MCPNDKRGTLNRSKKDRRIDTFIAVVNDCILVGVLDRKLRMAGAQARPDLCQDPGPIAVAIMIADIAGQRRNKSGPQIILASAIFRTVWVDKGQPNIPPAARG